MKKYLVITEKVYNPEYYELQYTQRHEQYTTTDDINPFLRALERSEHKIISVTEIIEIPRVIEYPPPKIRPMVKHWFR